MTMLITKFNRLIASKFVWIGFTILIVLAFVVWDMSVPEEAREAARTQYAGTLHGEPVPNDEFRDAYYNTYLSLILSYGQAFSITPKIEEEITSLAWKRLVTLRKAAAMELRVTNEEVISGIRNFPVFHDNGQFNPTIYRNFVDQFLPSLGFTPRGLEEHVRQELLLQKMQRAIGSGTLVSPADIDRAISTMGDEFRVEYVSITPAALGEGIEVTDEDVRAHFDANPDSFMLPPKRSVRYVDVRIEEFLDQVVIAEEAARDYYERNIEDFTTYADPEPDEDGNLPSEDLADLFRVAQTTPFEEVRDIVETTLRQERAEFMALERAMEMVMRLVPDRYGQSASFADAAEEFGLEIQETPPFSQHEVPEGIVAGRDFSRAAFNLRDGRHDYFSDPIRGEQHIYVMALEKRFPSRVPEYEEAAEEVREAALREARQRAMADLAQSFHQSAREAVQSGERSFADVAEEYVLPLQTPEPFTAADGLEDRLYGQELIRAVLGYTTGEVTDVVERFNRYLVAYVAQRTPANPAEFGFFRPQIMAQLATERGRILFEEWQAYLLREANFEPRKVEDRR